MLILFVATLVIAVVIIFAVQNALPVSVTFLTWHFGASLAVIVFLAFVTGFVAAILLRLTLGMRRAARRRSHKTVVLETGHNDSPK